MAEMTDKEYRQAEGLAQSTLKLLRDKTPAHALHAMQNKKGPSDATLIGSAVHAVVLESRIDHVVLPESAKGQSKLAKALRAEFEAEHSDKIILSQANADKVQRMADSVLNHKGASRLLSIMTQAELPIFWQEGETKMKAKIDGVCPLGIIDLKTTADADNDNFGKSIYNYGYHIQAAHYLSGAAANNLPCENFIVIAVENTEPHCTAIYTISHESIEAGEVERQKLLDIWRYCVQNNTWRGYSDKLQSISMPAWALRKIKEEF